MSLFVSLIFNYAFQLLADMVSSSASPDSLRKKLEEIFKLMLVVWAKEGLALKAISGKKTGKIIYELRLSLTNTKCFRKLN